MRLVGRFQTTDDLLKARPLYGNLRMYLVFIMGGGARFLFVALLTLLLIEVLNFPYTISYGAALTVGVISAFFYNRIFTFNTLTAWKPRLLKFVVIIPIIDVSNWVLVIAITQAFADFYDTAVLPRYYWPAIFLVTSVLSVLNFGLNKFWVFKR